MTKNYFRIGHEKQEFISLKAHYFMTRNQRRNVDCCAIDSIGEGLETDYAEKQAAYTS